MGFLRNEEVRRLSKYLRERIEDGDRLAQIQNELSSEYGEEFLREPDLLIYFPELVDEIIAAVGRWRLRVIPHAHLRMVQRGIKLQEVSALFRRSLEMYTASGEVVTVGPYSIIGRSKSRAARITIRADVDMVDDKSGQTHVVTIYLGKGETEGTTLIELS